MIGSGAYEKEVQRIREQLLPYIEKDPKAFFAPDQFETACETLLTIAKLRAESVNKQIGGELAARSEEQTEEDRVDTAGIDIKALGSVDALLNAAG